MKNEPIYLTYSKISEDEESHVVSDAALRKMIDAFDGVADNYIEALCRKQLPDQPTNTMLCILVGEKIWLAGKILDDSTITISCPTCYKELNKLLQQRHDIGTNLPG